MSDVQTGTVTTKVPARLDRLPDRFGRKKLFMITLGIVEIFLGVNAERRSLEDIAQPLTAADATQRPRQARATT